VDAGDEPAPSAEKNPAPAVVAAKVAVDGERYEEAVALLTEHLAGHPDDGRAWHRLAGALIGADRAADALDAADRAVALEPDNAVAHRMRALALMYLDRHDEAAQAATDSLALDATDADAHAVLGNALLMRDRPEGEAALRAALAIDPENRPAGKLTRRLRIARWALTAGIAAVPVGLVLGGLALVLAGSPGWLVLAGVALAAAVVVLVARRVWTPAWLIGTMSPWWSALGSAIVVAAALAVTGTPWRLLLVITGLTAVLAEFSWLANRRRAAERMRDSR
jgi:tetratricopeptide (TPR) repeat protein